MAQADPHQAHLRDRRVAFHLLDGVVDAGEPGAEPSGIGIKSRRITAAVVGFNPPTLSSSISKRTQRFDFKDDTWTTSVSISRYSAYYDSKIEWIGSIPISWQILKLKHIVKMQSGEQITADRIEDVGEFPVFGGNGLRGFTDAHTHDGLFVLIGRQGALCGNINYAQ